MKVAEHIGQWLRGTSNTAAVRDTRNGCRGAVRRTLALTTLTLLCGVPGVRAQKDSGAIVGVVKDASGGVVAAASAVAIDVERGEKLSATTDNQGNFVFNSLRIGRYKIAVSMPIPSSQTRKPLSKTPRPSLARQPLVFLPTHARRGRSN